MDVYSQKSYLDFESFLLKTLETDSSCLIVTLPGLGIRHFIKKFLEKHGDLNITHLESEGSSLQRFNILDPDFYKNPQALEMADYYFKTAKLDQKFALAINNPSVLENKNYQTSFLFGRLYSLYYFKARDKDDTAILAKEINPELTSKEVSTIFKLSGGIGRLIKFFSVNKNKLALSIEDLLKDQELFQVLKPTIDIIKKCSDNYLVKLGLTDVDGFVSVLLSRYFQENPINKHLNIQINADLSFNENGITSTQRLAKIEKYILDYLSIHDIIEREKISDFKWGEGKYDQYSDQAINKTIQRLNDKLTQCSLISIPKVGYKLQRKA